ncbi:hypothetical protein [Streptomyces sp. CC224B]|uniref:hypothetical protein n=1 Tax=Streptomyces sp. CC224B TaxID=3044571 RepID=UPI0024A8391F|nr:hypothetical protein [Streptomyces sp. CC224B]
MSPTRTFTTPEQLARALEAAAARVGPATGAAVRHEATALHALIQAAASGRPGPNRITGRYLASWRQQIQPRAHGASATVGTFAAQARRLELGFYGTDALGRDYAQRPFPHVAPALAALQHGLAERIAAAAKDAL